MKAPCMPILGVPKSCKRDLKNQKLCKNSHLRIEIRLQIKNGKPLNLLIHFLSKSFSFAANWKCIVHRTLLFRVVKHRQSAFDLSITRNAISLLNS